MGETNVSDKELVQEQHGQIGLTTVDDAALFEPTDHPDAQWFRDAGMGIFLHWGISSVKGMGISWPMIPGRALHKTRIEDSAERDRIVREQDWDLTGEPHHPTPKEYWALAPEFNPGAYDPDIWCAAFKKAGARYAVLTTKHHDGFAMWPSKYGDFNTSNWMGGRDLVRDFVEACRRHDLKIGLYFSGQDWRHDRDYRDFWYYRVEWTNPELPALDECLNPRDQEPWTAEEIAATNEIYPRPPKHWPAERREARYEVYRQFVRGQIEELLTRYGKIDIIWFDSAPPIPDRRTGIISMERIRELQPGIIINPRFYEGGDFKSYERALPEEPLTAKWNEFCDVWTGAWTHTTGEKYRATAWVIQTLAKCRAMQMNYLLGIGPDKNGQLVPEAYRHLDELADWMSSHSEAVFDGVRTLPENEEASVLSTARNTERFLFLLRDFRDGGCYEEDLLPLNDAKLNLHGVPRPRSVTLMRSGADVIWTHKDQTLSIEVSAAARGPLGDVVRVRL